MPRSFQNISIYGNEKFSFLLQVVSFVLSAQSGQIITLNSSFLFTFYQY